jgi:hypothetical protein
MAGFKSDNLDTIFYNPDHTKTYNPSGKPTGVVMTDFDIMEAKQAIQSLINEARIDEWKLISEVTHSANLVASSYLGKARDERIQQLRSEL